MREQEVVDGAHSFLHRNYESGRKFYCSECYTHDLTGRADLIFVQSRRDILHVVEAKRRANDVDSAIAQLGKYPANYKWIAIPADEYYSAEGVFSRCSETGIGLVLVSGESKFRVELKLNPVYIPGDFLGRYPKAERVWESITG